MSNLPAMNAVDFVSKRLQMVDQQLITRGIADPEVLAAMRTVPRHLFVPESLQAEAYADTPLPIGHGQTISQPYVVASMTEQLRLIHSSKVLEIGTGCGYQTAVLAEIAAEVISIEIVAELHREATKRLQSLAYRNVKTFLNDGNFGWESEAPYDAILVAATAPDIPPELIRQLRDPGRMVLPVSERSSDLQQLMLITKIDGEVRQEQLYAVRFVPLRGLSSGE